MGTFEAAPLRGVDSTGHEWVWCNPGGPDAYVSPELVATRNSRMRHLAAAGKLTIYGDGVRDGGCSVQLGPAVNYAKVESPFVKALSVAAGGVGVVANVADELFREKKARVEAYGDGYCYLYAVQPQYMDEVSSACGPGIPIERFVDHWEKFEPMWMLKALRVELYEGYAHLNPFAARGLNFPALCRALPRDKLAAEFLGELLSAGTVVLAPGAEPGFALGNPMIASELVADALRKSAIQPFVDGLVQATDKYADICVGIDEIVARYKDERQGVVDAVSYDDSVHAAVQNLDIARVESGFGTVCDSQALAGTDIVEMVVPPTRFPSQRVVVPGDVGVSVMLVDSDVQADTYGGRIRGPMAMLAVPGSVVTLSVDGGGAATVRCVALSALAAGWPSLNTVFEPGIRANDGVCGLISCANVWANGLVRLAGVPADTGQLSSGSSLAIVGENVPGNNTYRAKVSADGDFSSGFMSAIGSLYSTTSSSGLLGWLKGVKNFAMANCVVDADACVVVISLVPIGRRVKADADVDVEGVGPGGWRAFASVSMHGRVGHGCNVLTLQVSRQATGVYIANFLVNVPGSFDVQSVSVRLAGGESLDKKVVAGDTVVSPFVFKFIK